LSVSNFMMLIADDSALASAASLSRACSCLLSTNAQDSSDTWLRRLRHFDNSTGNVSTKYLSKTSLACCRMYRRSSKIVLASTCKRTAMALTETPRLSRLATSVLRQRISSLVILFFLPKLGKPPTLKLPRSKVR